MRGLTLSLFALLVSMAASCSSIDYAFQEMVLGKEKRHIMVSRVEVARDEQTEAKDQFKTTLERFKELTQADGGELEEVYEDLKDDYDRCVSNATDVTDRIDDVEEVAEDMFEEWRDEIDSMSSEDAKETSEGLLRETEDRYEDMLRAMRDAEAKMQPVLSAYYDQVTLLKHTLNARLISQLESTVVEIEEDVDRLIEEMERSIAEADAFIEDMNT